MTVTQKELLSRWLCDIMDFKQGKCIIGLICVRGCKPSFLPLQVLAPLGVVYIESEEEEEEEGPGFSRLCMHLINRGGIPLLPHTIDILLYTCDANIDTMCYTVCRFTIAA